MKVQGKKSAELDFSGMQKIKTKLHFCMFLFNKRGIRK